MLERELRDITAPSYRSRGLEKDVLERELKDIAVGSYRSRGLNKLLLERKLRHIVAGSYRSTGQIWGGRERVRAGGGINI